MRIHVPVFALAVAFPRIAWAQDAGEMPAQADPRATPPSAAAPGVAAAPPRVARPEGVAPRQPATPPPSAGTGALISGGVITGIGLTNLATAVPVCSLQFQEGDDRRGLCTKISLGIGGGITGLGLIILIVGGTQRSEYNDWKRLNALESHLEIAPARRGGTAGFRAAF